VYYLLIGLPITIAASIPLRIYPARSRAIRLFNIAYVDNRDDGGDFEIQYNDVRNGHSNESKKMLVKSITNNPKHRLEASSRPQVPDYVPMVRKMDGRWMFDRSQDREI